MVLGDNGPIVCNPGCIRSPGGEMTLVHVSINYDLLKKLEQGFGPTVWDIFYSYVRSSAIQHAKTYLENPEIKRLIEDSKYSQSQVFELLLKLLNTYGYGVPEIQETDLPNGEAKVALKDSTIANFVKDRRGFSTVHTCTYVSAFIAGLACVAYSNDFDAEEEICASDKGDCCMFSVFRSSERFYRIFLKNKGLSTVGNPLKSKTNLF